MDTHKPRVTAPKPTITAKSRTHPTRNRRSAPVTSVTITHDLTHRVTSVTDLCKRSRSHGHTVTQPRELGERGLARLGPHGSGDLMVGVS